MQPKSALTFFVVGLIISLAGSIIFVLTSPPQSYILFSMFLPLSALLTLTVLGNVLVIRIHLRASSIELHVFLVLASIILVILQLANIYVETINAILYVIVFIFGLGFSLLSLLEFQPSFSRSEFLALAYPLSLASLAIFGLITPIIPASGRGLVASMAIVLLSLAAFLSKRREKQAKGQRHRELVLKNNELILVATILFFVCFFAELYPQIASLLGSDIANNFQQALIFTKDTFENTGALYPLFGLYQSSLIYIAKPSVETFQVTMVSLNILALLSFHAMASQYLKKYGDHTAAIATLIWGTFAGFGWLNVLTNRIGNPTASLLSLIGQADAFSYGDTTWRRLFFYLSMEATFTLVFAVLYFLKRNDLSRTKQIILMMLLITPIPLMHPYGTYLLLPALLCFAVICTKELKRQLNYAAYSLVISSFASLLLNYVLWIKAPHIPINVLTFSGYVLTGIGIIAITSLLGRNPRRAKVNVEAFSDNKYMFPIAVLIILLYFTSLLPWLKGDSAFNFSSLNRVGYVPSFLYSVKLGVVGVLAISTSYILLRSQRFRSKELAAFLALALLMIFVSRILATIQMQYASEFTFNPNSWLSETIRQNILQFREERMFELFKVPLAVFASVALAKTAIFKTKLKKTNLPSYLATSVLISLILISGMASTFLGLEYYHNLTDPLSSSERNIINTMQNNIYAMGKATIIAPYTSYLGFTGTTPIVTESAAAWTSKSPELPLLVTRYSKATPTYIYLHKTSDYQELAKYAGNYLEHISNTAQTYLENQEVQVKIINNGSIPTPQSSTALVIPYDESTMTISEPFYTEEYKQHITLALFFEKNMQSMDFYQEPVSYHNIDMNETAIFGGADSYIRINGTGTNFNKILVEFEFQPLDLSMSQVIVSKFDYGTPSRKSWEISQYGKQIAFKISPDGEKEETLLTGEILAPNTQYTVRSEYDGTSMKMFIDGKIAASKPYQNGIFQSNTDLIIGAELYNGEPIASAKMSLEHIRVLDAIPSVAEPVFYAYDLLSSAGLNYTTTLSNDETRNNYETQVLPYDDIITYEMLTGLEANQQTADTHYVVILNTNGYGPLLNIFANITSGSFVANGIFTDEYSATQAQIDVPIITPNNDTEVKAQYVNNSFSSPFIMVTTQNRFTLVYVNIHPLIQQDQLSSPILVQIVTEVLGNYLEMCKEPAMSPWFYESGLLFKGLEADGAIQVSANSTASIELQENSTVKMNSETYYNMSTLNTEGYKSIQVNSIEVTVQKGYGFYTTLTAYNPSITLQNNNQSITMDITGNATFLIRQPRISVDGKIQFENFYMLHPPTIYTDGRNTTLSGKITLEIYVSDEATIALPYKFNSPITVKYEKPLMAFDEIKSFLLVAPYVILAMILIAAMLLARAILIKQTYKKTRKNESAV